MMTPPKDDDMGVPLNEAGRKAGDGWDLARDAASGDLCCAFGAGGLMRHPLRVRITRAADNTLRLETLSQDYDRRYGSVLGPGPTDAFIDAAYQTLTARKGTN